MKNLLTQILQGKTLNLKLILIFALLTILCSNQNTTVTPNVTTINSVTNYNWTITNLSTTTNSSVRMEFPPSSILDSAMVKVQRVSDGTLYSISIINNVISFNLNSSQLSNSTLSFLVLSVKNPPFLTFQNATFHRGGNSSSSMIVYSRGPITNCNLNFQGITDQLVSTAILNFTTTNPINKNRAVFAIRYGSYVNSIFSLAQYSNLTCSLTVSGVTYEVLSRITGSSIVCEFINLNLVQNMAISLRLINVRNPPFKNNYMTSALQVSTNDGSKEYDITYTCTLGDVNVETYQALFTQTSKQVNSVYNRPIVQTIQQISKSFQRSDIIQIVFSKISFSSFGSFLLFTRSTSNNQLIFNRTTTTTQSYLYQNTISQNQQNDKIKIILQNFIMQIPTSTSPTNLTFKFYRPITGGSNLQYLNIFATLKPIPVTFSTSNLLVTPTSPNIGQRTSYTFTLQISQALGSSSRILLLLPIETNISLINSNTVCTFNSANSGVVATCSIHSQQNRVIKVDLNSPTGITGGQTLSMVIGDIINPSVPSFFNFGANTFYDSTDMTSFVQTGSSLYSVKYTFRSMVVSHENIQYTVNQYPATLKLTYKPYVKLPVNTLIHSVFTTNLANIIYKSTSVNNVSTSFSVSSSPTQFNISLNTEIAANSTIVIVFEFKAPSITNSYNALQIFVGPTNYTNATLFERTMSPLNVSVSKPAPQTFTLIPTNYTTGVVNNYALNFYTNVVHPTGFFFLAIQFPPQITYTNFTCTGCRNFTDNSTSTYKVVIMNITTSNTSTYSITLNNIKNPSEVGVSNNFIITTQTASGQRILQGNSTVTITNPNTATARFDKSKFYYRMNQQPVTIFVDSLFNNFTKGDLLIVWFDYRTYNRKTGASILCSPGAICTQNIQSSTNYTLAVNVIPNNETMPIKFSIQGLNSSSTTFPYQFFEVIVRSYSNNSNVIRMKDEAKLTYNLSCTSTLTSNCRTCTLNACLSCYTGFYLYDGKCVTNCPSSSQYQAYANSTQCVSCKAPCSTCIGQFQCLTCVNSFFLNQSSYCISSCNIPGYYETTISNIKMCVQCWGWSQGCIKCVNGSSSGCTDCGDIFLQNGKCIQNCGDSTTYVDNTTKQCLPCNSACNGCTGAGNTQCKQCRSGFYNVSGQCISGCPNNTVPLNDSTCGCSGLCQTCQVLPTRCLSCLFPETNVLYNGQCLTDCPSGTYLDSAQSKCIDCKQGCRNCTKNACIECLPGYNSYQMSCYTQCNNLGERFAAVDNKCIQCPQGCDLCDANLICSVCLSNYTLVDSKRCQRTCQIQGNCQKPNPVPQKIIPIPGFITGAVWIIILVILKFFFINKMYLPYSYIFISCVIEYVLIIVVLAKMDTSIKLLLQNQARLLQNISSSQQTSPQLYQYAVLGILACSLALNYIQNFVFLYLFCKYLRKYVPDRQIDKISNYLVLILGVIINFRISLMAYSKMFPKPCISVQNQSKLTPVHYMCISSIFTSILPLTAAGILIYNEYALTDLFMLGIDLLLIVVISLIFTVWMVSVDKPAQYFQKTQKYSKQEFNQTTQAFNQKDDIRNQSKHKLRYSTNNIENSIIQVEDIKQDFDIRGSNNKSNFNKSIVKANNSYNRDQRPQTNMTKNYKSDYQNQPLPQIPVRSTQINLQTMKIKGKQNMQQSAIQIEQGKGENDDDMSLQEEQENRNKLKASISLNDKKTQRISTNRNDPRQTKMQKSPKKDKNNEAKNQQDERNKVNITKLQGQRGIRTRTKESPKNFGKQKNGKKKQKNDQLNLKIHSTSKASNQVVQLQDSEQLDESLEGRQPSIKPVQSDIIQRQKKVIKPATQRSSGIIPVTMKKKQSYGLFESQKAQSQVDEIDLQSIIQTKLIDKSNKKQKQKRTLLSKQQQPQEQISPSWFNQQNQRFDFQQNSET